MHTLIGRRIHCPSLRKTNAYMWLHAAAWGHLLFLKAEFLNELHEVINDLASVIGP